MCASDDQGYSCCAQQISYPVAKANGFPARCCPRWTIGCQVGTVGCCDPANPWQVAPEASAASTAATNAPAEGPSNRGLSGVAGHTVWALFVTADQGLESMQLNATTGEIVSRTKVSSFRDDQWDESVRDFVWDGDRGVFYYLDANFTAGGGVRPDGGRATILTTVDPKAATATETVLDGVTDFPTGFAYLPSGSGGDGTLTLATEVVGKPNGLVDQCTGYTFSKVDPETGKATVIGSISKGLLESSPSTYAGFHRAIAADGRAVRIGARSVTTGSGQGVSLTTLESSPNATWEDVIIDGHRLPLTLNTVSANRSMPFLSLVPSTNFTRKHGVDIVQWGLPTAGSELAPSKVIGSLGDAHPPREPLTGGQIGYAPDSLDEQTGLYAALVVDIEGGDLGTKDKWYLATADLRTGSVAKLQVQRGIAEEAGDWDACGVGIVAP